MKPLQVYVDTTELARLDVWSRERGWTESQAVRAAIRALTARKTDEPLLRASGFIDGLPPDVSARFDRYLARGRTRLVVSNGSREEAGYTDAVSFAVMKARGCPLAMTFDRHLTVAGFNTWPAVRRR